ncbi:hypothetical protein [Sphingobium sp. KCTC 72723]|uniref:hypothetical protein n=1 Tax=Sphingobium sp. KCTC 72723 TaxID=2733867 RepID=UPI00165D6627|nr:hypothetical protein [Sphingobium sp. KCTC 72723]
MTKTSALSRNTLTTRLGASPKTLHRKAMEKAAAAPAPEGESLEDIFPATPVAKPDDGTVGAAALPVVGAGAPGDHAETQADDGTARAAMVGMTEPTAPPASADEASASPSSTGAEDQSAPAAPMQSAAPASWSDADERAYQALATRRKAAGFQRRGRDVSAQRVTIGAVTPNPGTVNSTIYELVKAHGPIGRGELLDLMATPAFDHPKAKGGDRAWSQGYVQGAVAAGFLMTQTDDGVGERSPSGSAAA